MKKLLITLLLLVAVLASVLPVHAAEAEITVEVRASKSSVQVGDTVEFTVLATGSGVVAMQFEVRFPEGLRYVPNSGATPENLAQKLGVPAADWTEVSKMFTFYNDIGITFAKGTEILRFSCVAEKAGDWDVILFELLPFNGDFLEFPPVLKVQTVSVTEKSEDTKQPVTGETAPHETGSPETVPPVTAPTETEPSSVQKPTDAATQPTSTPIPTDAPSEDVVVTDPVEVTEDTKLPVTEALPETGTPTQSEETRKPEEEPRKEKWIWLIPAIGLPVIAIGALVVYLVKKQQSNGKK